MTKVLIVAPRLDCSFKPGYVPSQIGLPNHPIRVFWHKFIAMVEAEHWSRGDHVDVLWRPLWQVSPGDIEYKVNVFGYDLVYIPHRNRADFPLAPKIRALFYMQTWAPEYFSVDPEGWGASAANIPHQAFGLPTSTVFDELATRIRSNTSKFDQPLVSLMPDIVFNDTPKKTVFFPCQLPHDHTIKYHSKVSVIEALEATLEAAKLLDWNVIVKGHPANPESMQDLEALTRSFRGTAEWVYSNQASIHDLIKDCCVVTTVNSGVGVEALLHKKPVVTFGRAEYESVAYALDEVDLKPRENVMNALTCARWEEGRVRAWFDAWRRWVFDSRNPQDFSKLPS